MASTIALQRLSLQPSSQTQTLKTPFSPPRFSTLRFPNPLKPTPIKLNHHNPPWMMMMMKKKKITSTVHCTSNHKPVPATERIISTVAYTIPFIDGLYYGIYLFIKNPSLGFRLLEPIFDLLCLYWVIPFFGFISLLGLYLGVVRNPRFSRFLRFNLMMALVLDTVFFLVPFLLQMFVNPNPKGLWSVLKEISYSSAFVFLFGCSLYNVGFSVLGKTPYLPFVADAVDRQL